MAQVDDAVMAAGRSPLAPRRDLSRPTPLRVAFPVLLDGDLVMSPEHLGISFLVAVLRAAGAECRIYEVPADQDQPVVQQMAEWQPHVVGLSLTTIGVAHATGFGKAMRAALGPGVFILAGGPLATNFGAELLNKADWRFLDGLVRGEGEIPMLRFAEAFHAKAPFDDVPSLSWRTQDGIRETPLHPGVPQLDLLPAPARDQFESHGKRLSYLRLSTSRGCTGRCLFCNAPNAFNRSGGGKVWRGASPNKVVDEIEDLYRRYDFSTFDFVDSTFEDPGGTATAKARVKAIADEILRRDLKIYYNICVQARNWTEDDRDLIDLLFRSGLEKVLIGVESGSDLGLRRWKKKSSTEDNRRTIGLMRAAGIYVAFGFITFHPWSTFAEVRDNHSFLHDQIGHNLRRYTVRFELYPGAEAVSELREAGMLGEAFDTQCNPLAYRFEDPRIQRLASASALLYGDRYQQEGIIEDEPAVFEFETYDIVLHTFIARLKRHFGDRPAAAAILGEMEDKVERVRSEMASYNYGLMVALTDLAEAERLTDDKVREQRPALESFYRERLAELRGLQLKTSMALHRAGIPVRSIRVG